MATGIVRRGILRRLSLAAGRALKSGDQSPLDDAAFHCAVDRVMHFQGRGYVAGWAFHPDDPLQELDYLLPGGAPVRAAGWRRPSPDLVPHLGEKAAGCRFEIEVPDAVPADLQAMELLFSSASGRLFRKTRLVEGHWSSDPYHRLVSEYFDRLRSAGAVKVLEIGSRNVTGFSWRAKLGDEADYVGLDIVAGENVDIVGDAHELSSLVGPESFDSVFCMSTFEHLAMPWKVAIEINKVLKNGGTFMVATHHSWPLHEEPWDFWRFSDHSWASLFNRATGFDVVEKAMGEPASIVAHFVNPSNRGLADQRSYLGAAALCRKVGQAKATWDVSLEETLTTRYPR